MRTHEFRCTGCGRHVTTDHDTGKVPHCGTEGCKGTHAVEKFGFACKNCGKLIHAQHAGEQKVPHSCPNCGSGIHIGYCPQKFHEIMESMIPKGKSLSPKEVADVSQKIHAKIAALPTERKCYPDNFIVLADLSAEELKGHGLTTAQVEKWTPIPATPKTRPPQNVIRGTADGMAGVQAGPADVEVKKG